jgi:hypothetical protein
MLQQNELTGSIPIGIGWRKLRDLWLNGNDMQGSIPAGMGQLTDLVDIILEDNVSCFAWWLNFAKRTSGDCHSRVHFTC